MCPRGARDCQVGGDLGQPADTEVRQPDREGPDRHGQDREGHDDASPASLGPRHGTAWRASCAAESRLLVLRGVDDEAAAGRSSAGPLTVAGKCVRLLISTKGKMPAMNDVPDPTSPSTTRRGGRWPPQTSRWWGSSEVRASLSVESGHLPAGTRTRLVDAVLDAPEVSSCTHVQVALPLGETEILDRVRERCDTETCAPPDPSAWSRPTSPLPGRRARLRTDSARAGVRLAVGDAVASLSTSSGSGLRPAPPLPAPRRRLRRAARCR